MRFGHAPYLLMILALGHLAACGKAPPQVPKIPPEQVLAQVLGDLTEINYEEGIVRGTAAKLREIDDSFNSTDPDMKQWRQELARQIDAYLLPGGPKSWWDSTMGAEFLRLPLIYLAPEFQGALEENQRGNSVWTISRLRSYEYEGPGPSRGKPRVDLRLEFPENPPFEAGAYEFTMQADKGSWWIARMPMHLVRPDRLLSFWLDALEEDIRDELTDHMPGTDPLGEHPLLHEHLLGYIQEYVRLPEGVYWDDEEIDAALTLLLEGVQATTGYSSDTRLISQSRDEAAGTWTVHLQRTFWIEKPDERDSRIVPLEVQRDTAGRWWIAGFPKAE